MTSMLSLSSTKKGNTDEQRKINRNSLLADLHGDVHYLVDTPAREFLLGGEEMPYYNNDMNGWIIDHDFVELADYYYDRDMAIYYITDNHLEEDFLDWLFFDEDDADKTFDDIINEERAEIDDALYEYIVNDNYERSEDYARYAGWCEQEPDDYI